MLKVLGMLLLCGCAAFNTPGNADISSPQTVDETGANEKTVVKTVAYENAAEEALDGEEDSTTFVDYLPGRHVAAEIPYAKSLPWVGAPDSDERIAKTHFDKAEQIFHKKQYADSRGSYKKAATSLPDSALHEDSLFMIAETYFFEDNYPDAFEAYETLLVNYKRSRHLDKAVARQFAIGQYWQKRYQKDPENVLTPNIVDKTRPFNDLQGSSLRAFEKVRLNHPTGALADDSLMATANAYFLRERYEDADYHYGLVRREYPHSEHQYQAHFLGIQSKIRCYQGPQYDGMCLQEAKELIEQTIRQFAKLSTEDRQRLQRLHAQVLANLAFRDYEIAQFYANKGYYAAAKVYYNRVIHEFSHTEVANKAQQQLEKIEGEPSVPPPRLVWLSSLFPETKKDPLVLGTAPEAGENSQ